MTSDLRNKLFLQLAVVVLLVILLFEGALVFSISYIFRASLEDKLYIIANEIDINKISPSYIFSLQQKYHIYPLIIKIKSNVKEEGIYISKIKDTYKTEKILNLVVKKGDRYIQISTLLSSNDDNMEIIKTISMAISMFIYLIVLIIGYRFIDKIALNIDRAFNRLKMFNSNLSHELKTPLTIIKGEVEFALREKNCDEKLLKSILNEINYINEITDKLLFLTKGDNIRANLSKIDLEDVVIEIFEKYSFKIHMDLDIEDDEFIINGDKTLLFMAISNLVENSIKYGANEVVIGLYKHNKDIELLVKDDGIGIPKDRLPYIFDEFFRVDESRNKKIKGFGLGLSIVKSILNLHYAKIKVTSKEDEGVEFRIFFPIYK